MSKDLKEDLLDNLGIRPDEAELHASQWVASGPKNADEIRNYFPIKEGVQVYEEPVIINGEVVMAYGFTEPHGKNHFVFGPAEKK